MYHLQKQKNKNWALRKRLAATFLLGWIVIAMIAFTISVIFAK